MEKHFEIIRYNCDKEVESFMRQKSFNGRKKGIIVMFNSRRPTPQYFELVEFQGKVHFVVSSDIETDEDDK